MMTADSGAVIWITGLSGAGKSTVARLVAEQLRAIGRCPLLLDGDRIRELLGEASASYDREARLRLAQRYSGLCREISSQGFIVICATVSMFHAVQGWNRQHFPHYFELFLKVSNAELRRRDQKGIYSGFEVGRVRDVVGLDVAAEEPLNPDLALDNGSAVAAEATARATVDAIRRKFGW